MTHTQANEPGFVLLPDGWLAIEMKAAEAEIAKWPAGLRASFESLFLAAAPIAPAPAYGVKALVWQSFEDIHWAESLVGTYNLVQDGLGQWHWTGDKAYEPANSGAEGIELTIDEAKAAAQADFERRILSCLSSAPVEEADAKADAAVAEVIAESNRRDVPDPHLRRVASTIPPEPEAKGEAGAGPVGEAVALRDRLIAEHTRLHHALTLKKGVHILHDGDIEKLATLILDAAILADRAVEEPGELERLRAALQQAEGELSLIDCEGTTETRNLADVFDRIKVFASRGAANARAALSTQESSAALAGDGKEAGE